MIKREPGWNELRTFFEVVHDGSLSGAARRLGLTQPTVGRHIDALEDALASRSSPAPRAASRQPRLRLRLLPTARRWRRRPPRFRARRRRKGRSIAASFA